MGRGGQICARACPTCEAWRAHVGRRKPKGERYGRCGCGVTDKAGRQGTAARSLPHARGTDEVKVRKSIERLDARLEKTGYAEFNRDRMKGSDVTDPSALRASLDTLPFGSDFRLVIVDDVDAAPKSVTEEIVSYLANPCPTTVLIMTAKKLAKNTRLYKATAKLGDKAIVDCATLKRGRLPDRVVSLARDRGKVMSADAAELLVQLRRRVHDDAGCRDRQACRRDGRSRDDHGAGRARERRAHREGQPVGRRQRRLATRRFARRSAS